MVLRISLDRSYSVGRLEAFNAVISHHLPENANLVYGILRAHKTFEDLGTFTLARGLREVKRIQLAKEEQANKADAKGKSRAVGEHEQPHEEKQRLLERENSSALSLSSRVQSVDSLAEVRVVPRDGVPVDGTGHTAAAEELPSVQPLMSPTTESPPAHGAQSSVSEKVRGKMRERRSLSLDTDASLDRVAAAGVGRNGFVPTQEWVSALSERRIVLNRC